MEQPKGPSRRKFIQGAVLAALGSGAALSTIVDALAYVPCDELYCVDQGYAECMPCGDGVDTWHEVYYCYDGHDIHYFCETMYDDLGVEC
jgi:hypothetical protein